MFIRYAGIQVPAAHYRGTPPANTDLAAGQVAFMFDNPQTALPLIAAGRVRPIAVTAVEGIPELPEVPTAIESGMPDLAVASWHGIFMRSGAPREIILRITGEVNIALQSAEVRPLQGARCAARQWHAGGVRRILRVRDGSLGTCPE